MLDILPVAVSEHLRPRRIATVAVALMLAAVSAVVYRSFVASHVESIRVDVVNAEIMASRRIITVTLPDLAPFRGQPAVLGLRLQNRLLQERHIGLLRDGLTADRVRLPSQRTVHWNIVLPAEAIAALDRETGERARALDLTADGDGWALTGMEIRNYYVRVGGRLSLIVLPNGADAYTTGPGYPLVAAVLCFLALVGALGPPSRRTSLFLIGNSLVLTALLACLACLLLPAFSSYKVLLSPSAFLVLAAGLCAPVLLHAASRTPSLVRRMAATTPIVAGYWKRHDVTFERGAALLGLAAIAIAQPIFEVISNSPEFFAARGTDAATAFTAIAIMSLGLPFVLLGIERVLRRISPLVAAAFYGIALAFLSTAVVMPWFQRSRILASPWDITISAMAGAVIALGALRTRIVRQFLTALAPAALVVPMLFLLNPTVKESLLPSESAASVQTFERTPPIVFVVFDELPLNSLVDTEGNIDAPRYPNFAALARDAYWFSNATTVAANTYQAVPAILSGRYPTAPNDLPTLQYYPVNLFTTLARHYDISAFMRFQKLCPPGGCRDNSAVAADTVRLLLSDLGLVWLHIVLPQNLKQQLPPVTDDWAEFAAARESPAEQSPDTRGGLFAQFVSAIDARPARLHFIHAMLPHMSLEYVPSGRRYRRPDHETARLGQSRLFEKSSPAFADSLYQRHLAQVGFVDRLVGDVTRRLRDVGAYDQALVVITADHGASYREGRLRRVVQDHNLGDILPVPILMKLPGQRRGQVIDRIVETVDILPTVLDVLGADTPLRFDGRSLVDDQVPARSSRTFIWRNRANVDVRTVRDLSADRAAAVGRKERRFGRGDFKALYAPPGALHLLGTNVSKSTMPSTPDVRITIRNLGQFRAVVLARDPIPLHVTGVISTSRPDPLTIAVVVNGIVAAVTQSYRERDTHMFATLIPESSLRDGHNMVAAFVVDRAALRSD